MQSNNPIFTRNEAFNGQAAGHQNAYGQQGPGYGYGQTQTADPYGQYGDPSTWGTGAPVQQPSVGRMTIDTVVQKTAMTLGVVVLFAAITWVWAGSNLADNQMSDQALGRMAAAAGIGGIGAFLLSMVNSFKKVVSPALVIAFAAFEGVALGGISKLFDVAYPGVVTGAVIGTMAAFAGTLAAYKYFAIKVSDKFRRGVVAGMFGMVGLGLLSFVLSLFGIDMGLFSGGIGAIMSVVGLVLGVFMLIMDFDFVEQGIAHGLDERQSWTAAFAMTVSLVWIYTNLLRILAYFQQD